MSRSKVTCYLTRGSVLDKWHMWNTSAHSLVLRKGGSVAVRVVSADFTSTRPLTVQILGVITIDQARSVCCTLGQDVLFTEPLGELENVAFQHDLLAMCFAKGVQCAAFLRHYDVNPEDENELRLGSRACALFVDAVGEMLIRQYDIMHHFPLFSCSLSLYFSDESHTGDLPKPNDLTREGGLLDLAAEQHLSLHEIPLVGTDCLTYTKWNYSGDSRAPSERPHRSTANPSDDAAASSPRLSEDAGEGRHPSRQSIVTPDTEASSARLADNAGDICGLSTVKNADVVVSRVHSVNNCPGTLTDGPEARPCSYTVYLTNNLTFDDLVNYCLWHTKEPVGPLPPRDEWGAVNPVLIMEDPTDRKTGKTMRRYTITTRGHLSIAVGTPDMASSLCYNEVFLPGRPVSRLNLDVDIKCCLECNAKFALHAAYSTKREMCKAVAASLILVILDSLLTLVGASETEPGEGPNLRELAKGVGKIAVYTRTSAAKSKLSMRMLWYLPAELCSLHGIEAYGPLLEAMEQTSLGYALLSYPSEAGSCGLCELADSLTRGGEGVSSGSKYLRVHPDRSAGRSSSIDKSPYFFRKSVRLPNCYKDGSAFEYVDTFNKPDIEDSRSESPLSLSVGLSSNPVMNDVTCLGPRFCDVLRNAESSTGVALGSGQRVLPEQAFVTSEARRLSELWHVPVIVKTTGSGLICVQATEKSTSYPCPIHNRVHSKARLGALVFERHSKPKCFVA